MLDLDQKADEELGHHTHCVTGSPSLLTRTKARSKDLCRCSPSGDVADMYKYLHEARDFT
jgi:hypothetical protein